MKSLMVSQKLKIIELIWKYINTEYLDENIYNIIERDTIFSDIEKQLAEHKTDKIMKIALNIKR